MIKINTLTPLEIDKVKICEIQIDQRGVANHLISRDILTLLDLKNFVIKEGINGFYKRSGFGIRSCNAVIELLNHAYPDLVIHKSSIKYTYK
tara:strand:+ start:298 stop:573 length:276 start_codon:yes stop_codon:yes gene_type:complete